MCELPKLAEPILRLHRLRWKGLLDEHSEEVLAELGLDGAARADLRARGVVGWGNPWPAGA